VPYILNCLPGQGAEKKKEKKTLESFGSLSILATYE